MNEEEMIMMGGSWGAYHRNGSAGFSQGGSRAAQMHLQRGFPQQQQVLHASSRDPSPMSREHPHSREMFDVELFLIFVSIVISAMPMQSPNRSGEFYGMPRPAGRPHSIIDESAKVLHPSKSTVMNAVATVGLPFIQYELSATEARYPRVEEGHLFAALALDVTARRAARRARAAKSSTTEQLSRSRVAAPEESSLPGASAGVKDDHDVRFVLETKPLAERRAQIIKFLEQQVPPESDSKPKLEN
eukprot:Protomagalhaensia_sp_Gyna_25__4794@NODE_486_length_3288_cov_68_108033_g378_i0_p2_GENE_NODE_486_length_3288_cov_68_108033_g378_i0NODE_486_length_3288_cov_68_108033_g378_i0_p2_ORF_typecomplete_len245_score16_53_NODE_486_length_3288_cov_68_108033_g378_i04731207